MAPVMVLSMVTLVGAMQVQGSSVRTRGHKELPPHRRHAASSHPAMVVEFTVVEISAATTGVLKSPSPAALFSATAVISADLGSSWTLF